LAAIQGAGIGVLKKAGSLAAGSGAAVRAAEDGGAFWAVHDSHAQQDRSKCGCPAVKKVQREAAAAGLSVGTWIELPDQYRVQVVRFDGEKVVVQKPDGGFQHIGNTVAEAAANVRATLRWVEAHVTGVCLRAVPPMASPAADVYSSPSAASLLAASGGGIQRNSDGSGGSEDFSEAAGMGCYEYVHMANPGIRMRLRRLHLGGCQWEMGELREANSLKPIWEVRYRQSSVVQRALPCAWEEMVQEEVVPHATDAAARRTAARNHIQSWQSSMSVRNASAHSSDGHASGKSQVGTSPSCARRWPPPGQQARMTSLTRVAATAPFKLTLWRPSDGSWDMSDSMSDDSDDGWSD
jgi:hypothetical protein